MYIYTLSCHRSEWNVRRGGWELNMTCTLRWLGLNDMTLYRYMFSATGTCSIQSQVHVESTGASPRRVDVMGLPPVCAADDRF